MTRGDHVNLCSLFIEGVRKGLLPQRYAKDSTLEAAFSVRRFLRRSAAGASVLAWLKAAAKPSPFGHPNSNKVILTVTLVFLKSFLLKPLEYFGRREPYQAPNIIYFTYTLRELSLLRTTCESRPH